MIRIPDPGRFELRLMDGSANPYFLQAKVILLNLTNCMATALFQPVYDRFTFYTFQMVFFCISLIFVLFFEKKTN
ncbi:MAG: hypothetical protein CBC47_09595 [Alphaproteobacteria bacterium TMED87]|nr:hypothetical protein [Rhodospirillaceae bacterium]OUV07168.1 MAG: hypothetical protein CBC47_09595 [Alphaproteobacteria bacterium TMED87]